MDIFSFEDYRLYLAKIFREKSSKWRRADLCRALGCQASFLSQVITGKSHFSLEHAISASRFLEHDKNEETFFLILVQHSRAGSASLREHFYGRMKEEREKRQPIKDKIGVENDLSFEDQVIYYSHWWYSAIHILSALEGFQTEDAICDHLGLPRTLFNEAIGFLVSNNLVKEKNGKFSIGKTRIHIGSKDILVKRHHLNWRTKCMEVIEKRQEKNTHYTSVLGISKEGMNELKALIMRLLEDTEGIVRESKEEVPCVLSLDFFEL